jgi:hypothetical protein
MYAISRLKAALNAWYWVVHLRRRGKRYYRRFHDLKYGGSKKALTAAIAWRDEKLAQTKTFTIREFHQQIRSNNTSGVPGVHFHVTVRQPHGFWQATIKVRSGKVKSKTFSVRRFGARGAFQRAVATRRKMLEMVDDRPYLYSATAKRLAQRAARASPGPPASHRSVSRRRR